MNVTLGTSKMILGIAVVAAMLGACKKNDTTMTPNDATTTPSTSSGTRGTTGSSGTGTGAGAPTMPANSGTPYSAPAQTPDTMPPATTNGAPGTGNGNGNGNGNGTTMPPK